uniref:Uncharacterized protein n=1 Tax=Setaria viridis TaxID=4556 RepID=A0A4U6T923_SETVI|nr:hypothetical protein SEVIR_9G485150v2 [Setaria viridis]
MQILPRLHCRPSRRNPRKAPPPFGVLASHRGSDGGSPASGLGEWAGSEGVSGVTAAVASALQRLPCLA